LTNGEFPSIQMGSVKVQVTRDLNKFGLCFKKEKKIHEFGVETL